MGTEITLLQGDCREVLKTLDAESVQTVVTSPPYYGLRDYGTASWDGGDPACDHVVGEIRTGAGMAKLGERYSGGGHKAAEPKPMTAKSLCPRCGAVRVDSQIGLEQSPAEYVAQLVEVFREVRRVLRTDGTVWLNLGDSYCSTAPGTRNAPQAKGSPTAPGQWANMRPKTPAGMKPKDLMLIPARVAIALQDAGWWIRSDIIWSKPNPMPESVTDRPTKSHEYVFLLTKAERYFYDAKAIAEPAVGMNEHDLTGGRYAPEGQSPHTGSRAGRANGNAKTFRGGVYTNGKAFYNSTSMKRGSTGNVPNETGLRNARSVWTIATTPYAEAHFATFPPALAERCIKAGSKPGDTVLDPFAGAGTTLLVADRLQRDAVGIELNAEYCALIRKRLAADAPLFTEVA